ncbi:MAG: glutamate--cysteine ligase [Bacillota bacterium]
MNWNFITMSDLFNGKGKRKLMLAGNWGLEKESQRVTPLGDLALTDHPSSFGDKLENPYITTDFSESQLELITPPFKSIEETYESLKKLQLEAEKGINDELLWPLSMPPRLPDEDKIPIAKFNSAGKEKEIYRNGLALRYGKKMQMISGIHYNFSFSDEMIDLLYERLSKGMERQHFVNWVYFALIRNYLRYRWLLIYLFGASPVIDPTYYPVIYKELKLVSKCCPECCNVIDKYEQYSTSLRVSRFGYSSTNQGRYNIYYTSMEEYIKGLDRLLAMKSKKYIKLGVYKDGIQIQLNENILQKESEFYSSIRPKQILEKGETQLEALRKRGVKYLEVRILDLNPFEKVGISIEQLYFLQVFMLFCLFEESKPITKIEYEKINKNHHLAALCGRKPRLKLYKYDNGTAALKEWGNEIFDKLKRIAELMDQSTSGSKYLKCVANEYQKLTNPELLPSSLILMEMKENNETYLDFGVRRATMNKQSK